jgi:hypothetical protein
MAIAPVANFVPSTSPVPGYGNAVAVASMTNGQAQTYLLLDVSLGNVIPTPQHNGLLSRIADGRIFQQGNGDYADAVCIRGALGIGQGGSGN